MKSKTMLPLLLSSLTALSSFVSISVSAQAQNQPAVTNAAREMIPAKVGSSGANVYSRADFDSPVLSRLNAGQSVQVTRGKASGPVGKFHQVRIGNRVGYVSEIDVTAAGVPAAGSQPQAGQRRSNPAAPVAKPGENAKARQKTDPKANRQSGRRPPPKKEEKPKQKLPFYFSRFIGVLVGSTQFKEDIAGVNAQDSLLIYGLKITGPDVVFSGPVMDLNIALHYGAPRYYESLTRVKPTGYVILVDALLLLPFTQGDYSSLYLGLGPLISYSSFRVLNNGRSQDLSTLNLGAALSLGAGWRMDKVTLRLEGKYLYEKKQNTTFQASLQTEF